MIISLMGFGAKNKFSKGEYRQLRQEANRLYNRLTEENSALPKALKQRTAMNIFPAIAVYKTLAEHGMNSEDATDVIRQFFIRICGLMFTPVSWYQHIGGTGS